MTRQPFLNSSAILAFTEIVRQAQESNNTAHNPYHVRDLANPSSEDSVVTSKYITYLAHQLKSAIQDADSPKILVYVRALGNLAHPQMLSIFEPYLEGKEAASDFQRLAMVAAMDKLAHLYPRLARSVLFKIYQNTGEDCAVRCAAVYQLMKTNPPASMLQRMAQFTNWDLNKQVNSAVKTAIETAAELDTEDMQELAANARAARDMLNPRSYGTHYSQSYLRDYVIEEMNLAYQLAALSIGSDDSVYPLGFSAHLKTNYGGYDAIPFEIEALLSSIDDLTNLFTDQIDSGDSNNKPRNRNNKQNGKNNKWTPENIAKWLNIESDDAEQFEGQLKWNTMSANHFFAFDNHTIEQIPNGK